MPPAEAFLPPDPVARYARLHQALFARKAWYQGGEVLRHTALAMTSIPGEPDRLVQELHALADELANLTPWYGSLRNSIRFLVASVLLRRGERAVDFVTEVQRAGTLFREHWKTSGNTFELLAILALRGQSKDGRVSAGQVARLAAIWQAMKRHHPFLTQRSDWPAAAMLAGSALPPAEVAQRIETLYRGIDGRGYSKGDALQTAAQILFFHADPPETVCARFDAIFKHFKAQGLWMLESDYDEVALLTFATQDESEVVGKVAEHRESIAALSPRPGKLMSFNLACGTALLSLLRRSTDVAQLSEAQALLRIVTILQAQQAAVIAAAAAGGAAAAG